MKFYYHYLTKNFPNKFYIENISDLDYEILLYSHKFAFIYIK